MKRFILNALKGFGMGAANVVPGVSGGTVALITGIYTDIVDSLNSLTEYETWKSLFKGEFRKFWACIRGTFLLALALGLVVSVFSLAKAVTFCLENSPILTWSFFFGLVLASGIVMLKGLKFKGLKDWVWTLLGLCLGLWICSLSPSAASGGSVATEFGVAGGESLWYVFLCGAVSICAMVLPGISGSFIMILFGKYDYIISAVAELNWVVIIVFGLGCVVGLLAFAKLLHYLLARWEKQTMFVLLGFVFGSLVKIWPWHSAETGFPVLPNEQVLLAAIFCILGIVLVVGIDIIGNKKYLRQLQK